MPSIKRLPLPDPFTIDVAVRHLYLAHTNRGRCQLHQIALINPHMVDAFSALWRREHLGADTEGEHKEQKEGHLEGIGSFRLSRAGDGTGTIDIEFGER